MFQDLQVQYSSYSTESIQVIPFFCFKKIIFLKPKNFIKIKIYLNTLKANFLLYICFSSSVSVISGHR